jgi:hypothetical protein
MLDAAFLYAGGGECEFGRKQAEVDEDYKQAATLAALVAPYRHARLSAVKLAGDPNNPARFKDDATLTSYARKLCSGFGFWFRRA